MTGIFRAPYECRIGYAAGSPMRLMRFDPPASNGKVVGRASLDGREACTCTISVDSAHGVEWDITGWYVDEWARRQGIGRWALASAMKEAVSRHGLPHAIRYIWNGENGYVLDWLERHFDAVCACPLAVRKTCPDDDRESHIYELDRDKVLGYFGIG